MGNVLKLVTESKFFSQIFSLNLEKKGGGERHALTICMSAIERWCRDIWGLFVITNSLLVFDFWVERKTLAFFDG